MRRIVNVTVKAKRRLFSQQPGVKLQASAMRNSTDFAFAPD
jgi:hypothetical protein